MQYQPAAARCNKAIPAEEVGGTVWGLPHAALPFILGGPAIERWVGGLGCVARVLVFSIKGWAFLYFEVSPWLKEAVMPRHHPRSRTLHTAGSLPVDV
jgi:hypothetical protein